MSVDLVEAANKNYVQTFFDFATHSPVGKARRFGDVTAAAYGGSSPFFNRVFVLTDTKQENIERAIEWIDDTGFPYFVTSTQSHSDQLADLPLESGAQPQPGMVLDSLDVVPKAKSELDITEVTSDEGIQTFSRLAVDIFGMGDENIDLFHPVARAEGLRIFIGQVDGEPIACGNLCVTDDVVGVYTIGVREEHRRRGYGRDMTWALLRAGQDRGCTIGVLQSSEMGLPLYQEIGFETVVTYEFFQPIS